MPLLDPSTQLTRDQLLTVRRSLLDELRETPEMLQDAPGAEGPIRARGRTARELVLDTLAWADQAPVPEEPYRLVAEINLFYDVTIVAAEYYKLFVRVPTPERPAGRI